MAVLRVGSKGPDVTKLHQLLHEAGAYTNLDKDWSKFTKLTKQAVIYFQQTHLASDGVPLAVDGAVGDNTWWALQHQSGKAQRSLIKPDIPKGLSIERGDYLRIALREHAIGVRERPNGSNRSKEIDKYIPQWWFSKHASRDKGMPWCAFYVSWCDKEALGHYTLGRRHGSCRQIMNAAKKVDLWRDRDSRYFPIPGDWFVMLYGVGKGHIGFVLRVSKDGKKINTVEGNCGNCVKVGLRDVDEKIVGFVNPFSDELEGHDFTRGIRQVASVGKDTIR